MNDGHRTSTIPRPEGAREASRAERRPPSSRDDTRLVQRRRSRNVLAFGGVAITLAVAAALFVLPFRAWLTQRSELTESKAELAGLQAANDRLDAENERLQTAEGVAAAARDDLGYQKADEEAVAALPPPAVPLALPSGWPYDVVGEILAVRTVDALRVAQAEATAATSVAPGAEASATTLTPQPTTAPTTSSVSPP